MDSSNYAHWHQFYLVDMYKLEERHPEVYQEFTAGNHTVGHSQQAFAQVIYSHGHRTIFDLDSKFKGGIFGISGREDAVERWFLTSHERAAISKSVKEMCGVEYGERTGTHKEASATQVKRDEDVEKLFSSFISGLTTHLFMILEGQYAADKFLFRTSQQLSFFLMKWETVF